MGGERQREGEGIGEDHRKCLHFVALPAGLAY